jgi:hypothetical protein
MAARSSLWWSKSEAVVRSAQGDAGHAASKGNKNVNTQRSEVWSAAIGGILEFNIFVGITNFVLTYTPFSIPNLRTSCSLSCYDSTPKALACQPPSRFRLASHSIPDVVREWFRPAYHACISVLPYHRTLANARTFNIPATSPSPHARQPSLQESQEYGLCRCRSPTPKAHELRTPLSAPLVLELLLLSRLPSALSHAADDTTWPRI